jgi:uncharacterized protein YjiS (DUF1127 family)
MSMLHHTSGTFTTSGTALSAIRSSAAWFAQLLNGYIAKVIAYRERQANLHALRHFTDRELMDMGLNRTQIGDGLVEAAKERSALQELRQRQSMMS